MLHHSKRHLLPLALTGLLVATTAVPAQKPAAVKRDPVILVKLKEFDKLIRDRKTNRDAEARAIIDELLKRYEKLHPKDQAAFAKGIAKALTSKRCVRKATNDGLFRTAIKALGRTGKNGSNYLWKAFDDKGEGRKFKGDEWLNLRGEMLEHLGRTKHERFIPQLMEAATRSHKDTLMARAGAALRHFADSTHKVRRDLIVKDLHKRFAEIHDNANASLDPKHNFEQQSFRNTLAAISDPWNVTLQKLTRQSKINTTAGWTRFWAKHKGDRTWDPKKSKGKPGKS